ncbi:unnamed protein product [Eruca vesicaria subsp. sativa]|uniref:KIB1-4 beta-propeller domain-containing protein n=1 Tax=Eruca vesicaria subsp. sativa TaxID=29727 RepID=A0ABC8K2T9_ERUVS|nr:unnamed protein product [Eruca vesicaria subsp. sativa]
MPDWSLLPEELIHFISLNHDNCFDVVHARSVCTSWRSTFPFSACLLRPSYSLPTFAQYPRENERLCILEKFPLFLFRVKSPQGAASEYFLGGISRYESKGRQINFPSPLQCSVKVNIPESQPALMNMLECQIFPLSDHYRMIGWDIEEWKTKGYRGVAFLPLIKERGGGFIVLVNYSNFLLVLRSAEMEWIRLKRFTIASCQNVIVFRGKFYGTALNRDIFFIDPFTLQVTPLMPLQPLSSRNYLVPSGNDDELFLVEKIIPPPDVSDFSQFTCRVCRLDEEAGKWVEVSDVGGRVLFIGHPGSVSCFAKELPDSCGVSGNSLLFTNGPGNETYTYKYGVNTGCEEEEDLNIWSLSGENHVMTIITSPVVAFRVQDVQSPGFSLFINEK